VEIAVSKKILWPQATEKYRVNGLRWFWRL